MTADPAARRLKRAVAAEGYTDAFRTMLQSADAVLAQCRDRNYAARFVGEGRPVYYVGVNYDPKARMVDDVKAEAA